MSPLIRCLHLLLLQYTYIASAADTPQSPGLGVSIRDNSDDASRDPFDLSFYKKGAAIGDSYTAGIGAGNRVQWGCSRYDGSYASLVALQLEVDPDELDFTYTACSGAVVDEITTQAKKLSTGQEFVMMTAVRFPLPSPVGADHPTDRPTGRQRCQARRYPQFLCL